MRKLVLSEYMSLDGVIQDPAWTGPFWNDEIAKFKYDELFSSDALVLGRVTYEGFSQAWPTMTDTGDFGERMNSLPKDVASRTLKEAHWNASLMRDHIPEQIARLKEQPGGDLLVGGSGTFAQTLIQHDLIDRYQFLIYPVVLGSGKRLFQEGVNLSLRLTETRPFSSGVVALIYEPERKKQ